MRKKTTTTKKNDEAHVLIPQIMFVYKSKRFIFNLAVDVNKRFEEI